MWKCHENVPFYWDPQCTSFLSILAKSLYTGTVVNLHVVKGSVIWCVHIIVISGDFYWYFHRLECIGSYSISLLPYVVLCSPAMLPTTAQCPTGTRPLLGYTGLCLSFTLLPSTSIIDQSVLSVWSTSPFPFSFKSKSSIATLRETGLTYLTNAFGLCHYGASFVKALALAEILLMGLFD